MFLRPADLLTPGPGLRRPHLVSLLPKEPQQTPGECDQADGPCLVQDRSERFRGMTVDDVSDRCRPMHPKCEPNLDLLLVGTWESSGILDVTSLFKTKKGERLLILDIQADSLTGGLVASIG